MMAENVIEIEAFLILYSSSMIKKELNKRVDNFSSGKTIIAFYPLETEY